MRHASDIPASAAVIGSGPNGLAAAGLLAEAGLPVDVWEAAEAPGGGVRSAALTLPGFSHDVCSAIYPFARAAPALAQLELEWLDAPAILAHPLDDGTVVVVEASVEATAARLGADSGVWRLIALLALGHAYGWPFPRRGAQRVTEALVERRQELGGRVHVGRRIDALPCAGIVLRTSRRASCCGSQATGCRRAPSGGCASTGTGPAPSRSTGLSTDRSPGAPRSARALLRVDLAGAGRARALRLCRDRRPPRPRARPRPNRPQGVPRDPLRKR